MLIKMRNLDYALEEVLVVAYGISSKGAYTGSASVVNAALLENRLVTDVTKALSGTVAGVADPECKCQARYIAGS